jgi:hypothetical protein
VFICLYYVTQVERSSRTGCEGDQRVDRIETGGRDSGGADSTCVCRESTVQRRLSVTGHRHCEIEAVFERLPPCLPYGCGYSQIGRSRHRFKRLFRVLVLRGQCFILRALYPSKSGPMHKHIVKHVVADQASKSGPMHKHIVKHVGADHVGADRLV